VPWRRGYLALRGEGVGDAGDSPAEPSLLILGIAEGDTVLLGREFGQLAVVCGELGTAARLVLCWGEGKRPSVRESGSAENGRSVNWAFMRPMLSTGLGRTIGGRYG
jgi:hypothetical protein